MIPCQRDQFDIPPDVAYLNCAYMSPLSHRVLRACQAGLELKRRPWEIDPRYFFELADRGRAAFARLLGAPASADDVAIVPAASYGMAVAARNVPLRAGQQVIVLQEEFPSSILTWRDRARSAGAALCTVPRPGDHDWTGAVLAAIDGTTACAVLPHNHWFDGAQLDLAAIRRGLDAVGGALVLDLTQSLGAAPLDFGAVAPDFLVAASYKCLMGPYSIGFLYAAPRWHQGTPLEHHWFGRAGSENFSALTDYPEAFQPGARRFDMGEAANFTLLPGAVAAIEQILEWGVADIADTTGRLTDLIAERAGELGYAAVPTERRARHYLGLRMAGGLPADLSARLVAERVSISIRGGQFLRITPHVYNDLADVDRLIEALARASERQPA
ncbi:MAG: aminotransferase class V-fold PLP-dependent enzyme [Gemmatimonadetes bacterium]|nr:aminotransferase class V-fold PLP-dependent enzyme [Gemmatimonadota bacterium]